MSIIFFYCEDGVVKVFRAVEQPQQNLLIKKFLKVDTITLSHLLSTHISKSGLYTLLISISEIFYASVKQKPLRLKIFP